MFFGLGLKGVPKAAQGGSKGSSEGSKGVPSERKVSSVGSHRSLKGVPKGLGSNAVFAKVPLISSKT